MSTERVPPELLSGDGAAPVPTGRVPPRSSAYEGDEPGELGAQHNVEERPRIEGSLPHVLREMFAAGSGIVRRPSRLVGTRFREVPEYPEFSWKEAILNAVAHRDYSAEGRTTEVWFYDDRLEVVSPGGLLPDVRVEALRALERVHASRNPRTVRALVDLGLMRDQGEGIPRMFAEMEGLFLPAPTLDVTEREVRVTLRNTPTLTAEDQGFIAALGDFELSDLEFRTLLEAFRHGSIENARMRAISGLDTLGASQVLRKLRDRGALELHAAGAASYYTLASRYADDAASPDRGELGALGASDRGEPAPDRGELGSPASPDRVEPSPAGTLGSDLSEELLALLRSLGPRPRQPKLRAAILRLVEDRARSASELAGLLGLSDVAKLVERHLRPMLGEGSLQRTHPENPTHPDQAYRACQRVLGDEPDDPKETR